MDSVPKINSNKPNGYIYMCVCLYSGFSEHK